MDGGIIILSKYPITDSGFKRFKQGSQYDDASAKGIIYCKIEVKPNVYLHIYNTHIQAIYGDTDPEVTN